MYEDKNIRRCGLAGTANLAFGLAKFAVFLSIGLLTGFENDMWPVRMALGYATGAISLLALTFLALSSVKGARVLFVGVAFELASILFGRAFAVGMPVYLVGTMLMTVFFAVLVGKNEGEIRRALVFFLVAWLLRLLGVLNVLMSRFGMSMNSLMYAANVIAAAAVLVSAAGYWTLLFDVNAKPVAADPSAPRQVSLHWRIFIALAPLLVVATFPVGRATPALLAAPMGLAALFPNVGSTYMPWFVVGGWLLYLSIPIVIVFSRLRRTVIAAIAVFLALILLNVVGWIAGYSRIT